MGGRKVVQFQASDEMLMVLCEDGTLWQRIRCGPFRSLAVPEARREEEGLFDSTERQRLQEECAEARQNYQGACGTVAAMHAAAMGEVTAPVRGVVEDIKDLRIERDNLRSALSDIEVLIERAGW